MIPGTLKTLICIQKIRLTYTTDTEKRYIRLLVMEFHGMGGMAAGICQQELITILLTLKTVLKCYQEM